MENVHSWALKFENTFRIAEEIKIPADDFSQNFREALENSLIYFAGQGLIPAKEIEAFLDEFTAYGESLNQIISTDCGKEKIEELLEQLAIFKNNKKN